MYSWKESLERKPGSWPLWGEKNGPTAMQQTRTIVLFMCIGLLAVTTLMVVRGCLGVQRCRKVGANCCKCCEGLVDTSSESGGLEQSLLDSGGPQAVEMLVLGGSE